MADWRPGTSTDILRLRARVKQALRAQLNAWNLTEVDPPCLVAAADFEPNIDSFRTQADLGHAHHLALHSSPELMMKRLLAADAGSIYYLGPVFRNGEAGHRHNPEFTMLEWYRLESTLANDHLTASGTVRLDAAIADTLMLLQQAARVCNRELPAVRHTTYHDLFLQHTGLEPHTASRDDLRAWADQEGLAIHAAETLERDDWLNLIVSLVIEPQLPVDEITVVRDFPASQAALAQHHKVMIDDQTCTVAARFEVYGGRLELANGYDELTDPEEQLRRFARETEDRIEAGKPVPMIDPKFLSALSSGLPNCYGVALGFDRLMMWLTGRGDLDGIQPFTIQRL